MVVSTDHTTKYGNGNAINYGLNGKNTSSNDLVSATDNIRVYPPVVEFQGVEAGLLYVLTLSIQNVSNSVRRIRIQPPSTSYFSLVHVPTAPVAAGLDVKAEIEFQMKDARDYHDKIVVMCGDQKIEVPLRAYLPAPKIEFDSFVSIGTVVLNHSSAKFVEFENHGYCTGSYNITYDPKLPITVSPVSGQLAAKGRFVDTDEDGVMEAEDGEYVVGASGKYKERIRVDFHGRTLGVFRAVLEVNLEGQPSRILDINATVVRQSLELVLPDGGGHVNSVPFGSMYFGEERSITTLLVNNGPQPSSYQITLAVDNGQTTEMIMEEAGRESRASHSSGNAAAAALGNSEGGEEGDYSGAGMPVAVSPMEGMIQPYSQVPVSFTFKPRLPELQKGFRRTNRGANRSRGGGDDEANDSSTSFSYLAVVEGVETKQNLPVRVSGRAAKPLLTVSDRSFMMGECGPGQRRDVLFTLRNAGELPLDFSTNRVAYFSTRPARGRLQPLQSQSIVLSFSPAALGTFKNTLHLVAGGGLQVILLKVSGSCSSNVDKELIQATATFGAQGASAAMAAATAANTLPGPGGMTVDGTLPPPPPTWKVGYENSAAPIQVAGRSKKKLVGGTDKSAKDFQPSFNFVQNLSGKALLRAGEGTISTAAQEARVLEKRKEFKRISPWDAAAAEGLGYNDGDDFGPDQALTYSVQDLARRAEHRGQYNRYLGERRAARLEKEKAIKVRAAETKRAESGSPGPGGRRPRISVDVLNLGMDRGLASPEPTLQDLNEPLWLERPLDGRPTVRKRGGRGGSSSGGVVDENRLVKKKFKPRPTTQAEVRDCGAVLSASELHSVSAGPKTLDFGRVSINSVSYKSFGVTNDLPQSVLVQLGHLEGELKSSGPASQVLPPGATAGFDICFTATSEQTFRRSVSYVLNEGPGHTFKFSVLAQVVPITVNLSRDELVFSFGENNLEASVNETLTISNPGNAACDFMWIFRGAFTVSPVSGRLEPGAQAPVQVTFTPSPTARVSERLTLRVAGGGDQYVDVRGVVDDARCSFAERKLDFGTVAVGIRKEKTCLLKNIGTSSAVFFLEPFPPGLGLVVGPSKGRIASGDAQELTVSLNAPTAKVYEGLALSVNVRGGRLMKLPLLAEAVVPEVSLVQDRVDFQGVTIGATEKKPVSVQNHGNIPALLNVDLSRHPDFSLLLSQEVDREDDAMSVMVPLSSFGTPRSRRGREGLASAGASVEGGLGLGLGLGNRDGEDESGAATGGGGGGGGEGGKPKQQGGGSGGGDGEGEEGGQEAAAGKGRGSRPSSRGGQPELEGQMSNSNNAEDEETCRRWRITVPPASTLPLFLTFAPTSVASHDFQLPISLVGIPSVSSLMCPVTAAGLKPRLLVSAPVVDFGERVVPRDRVRKIPYGLDVTFTNDDVVPLNWSVDVTALRSGPLAGVFHVAPATGLLGPGEFCGVRCSFLPASDVEYETTVPLHLDGRRERAYINLHLSGRGIYPRLSFDRSELVLPVVPLSISSSALFHVINTGYDNLELRYRMPADAKRVPITLKFPEGKTLGIAQTRLPVEVSFSSKRSVSFTATIDFFDADGNRFPIVVTGTADNSLMTNHGFVQAALTGTGGGGGGGGGGGAGGGGGGGSGSGSMTDMSAAGGAGGGSGGEGLSSSYLQSSSSAFAFYAREGGPVLFYDRKRVRQLEAKDQKILERQLRMAAGHTGVGVGGGGHGGGAGAGSGAAAAAAAAGGAGASASGARGSASGPSDESPVGGGGVDAPNSIDTDGTPNDGASIGGGGGGGGTSGPISTSGASNGSSSSSGGGAGGAGGGGSSTSAAVATRELELLPMDDHGLQVLLRWINTNVARTPIVSLPGDVVAANGRPVLDVIEILCGKPVPGRVQRLSQVKREQWSQLVGQYRAMLAYLTAAGALLHHVRPEQLLNKDDYTRAKEGEDARVGEASKITPGQAMFRRHSYEREWPRVARAGWSEVLLQTLRVFVLNRVTLRALRSLPGMAPLLEAQAAETALSLSSRPGSRQGGKTGRGGNGSFGGPRDGPASSSHSDPTLQGSNVYSVAEAVLLQWVGYHVSATRRAHSLSLVRSRIRLTTFDRDLADGSVLCHLLASHLPQLRVAGAPLETWVEWGEVKTVEQRNSNMNKVVASMKAMQLDYALDVKELLPPLATARNNLLLLLYLWQQLPQFVPKTVVEFAGLLGQPVRKSIELHNPSKRTITYAATLEGEGSADFQTSNTTLRLEPGQTESFQVSLVPRFTRPVEARLTFRSRREAGTSAATLVFVLRSKVHARQAIRTFTLDCAVYEQSSVELEVTNPYGEDGEFSLSLVQDRGGFKGKGGGNQHQQGGNALAGVEVPPIDIEAIRRDGSSAIPLAALGGANPKDGKEETDITLEPFYCRSTRLKMKPAAPTSVTVYFLAFLPGLYKCQVVFLDPSQGEFVYEIVANAALPAALDTLRFSSELKTQMTKDLQLPVRNSALDKARLALMERGGSSSSSNAKTRTRDFLRLIEAEERPPCPFKVEMNSPYYAGPPDVVLGEVAGGKKKGAGPEHAVLQTPRGPVDPKNRLTFSFHPKAAGLYPCKLVLRAPSVPGQPPDIRVYDLEGTVTAPGVKTSLDFSAPARQSIIQEIPIVNNSSSEWVLRSTLSGGSGAFSGPSTLTVPAKATANYILTFRPSWCVEVTGTLVLVNLGSSGGGPNGGGGGGERLEYELHGVGLEPLAEDHVVITCQARERIQHTFTVENFTREAVNYSVESDLPHVSGASSVKVGSGSRTSYTLTIHPQLGGTYSGAITFLAPNGEFQWYTVEVQASSPQPEAVLDIVSFVRRAVGVEIRLANPLPDPVEFEVVLQGNGLLGDPAFVLQPQEQATYELLYSPLVPGLQTGSVSFINDRVGEFWYKLNLTADPAPATRLEAMSCPVGTSATQRVSVENPTGEEVQLVSKVDNRRNYSVQPSVLLLRPYSSSEAMLTYTPASVGEPEAGELSFSHPQLGSWAYTVQGRGLKPGVMPEVVVTCAIGERASELIAFRNPFQTALNVDVKLLQETGPSGSGGGVGDAEGEDGEVAGQGRERGEVLQLLLKKSRNVVPPFSTLQIPLSFTPRLIAEKRAKAEVNAGEGLVWTFPIKGIAEAPPFQHSFNFTCRARSRLEATMTVELRGLGRLPQPETFTHEVLMPEGDNQDPKLAALVSRSLTVLPLDAHIVDGNSPLRFQVLFEPLRPFGATAEFIVNKASGGRWRFELVLEAQEPEVDDVIHIEANLHMTSSVSFRLTNQFLNYAPFTATFSPDSPFAFTVYPPAGMLEPYGREGTSFVVSFTPSEYGTVQVGRLIIQTEEMRWTYEVRGSHPEYRPPESSSRVVTQLDPAVAAKLGKPGKPGGRAARAGGGRGGRGGGNTSYKLVGVAGRGGRGAGGRG